MSDNPYFDLKGWNHTAFISGDMARTVDFYQGVLGMPLNETVQFANGGQHFFFDAGTGKDLGLGFIWYPNGAPHGPCPARLGPDGAVARVEFRIAPEHLEEYFTRLKEKGVECELTVRYVPGSKSDLASRAASRKMSPADINEDAYSAVISFKDPDGIPLAFSAYWDRVMQRVPRVRAQLRHGSRRAVSERTAPGLR
jgi:catechol 2,3-dioxygenase-like lactoylglutathione lyase family enzyme